MIQYIEKGTDITVKLDGRVAGTITYAKGHGFYYVPKGKSKHPEKGDHQYFKSLDEVKRNLEQE